MVLFYVSYRLVAQAAPLRAKGESRVCWIREGFTRNAGIRLQFGWNCFGSLGLGLVLLGTDFRAAELPLGT